MQLRNGKVVGTVIGYSKAVDMEAKIDRILTLEIPVSSKHNMNRKGISNRFYAKYRCSEARIVSIDPPGAAISFYDKETKYEVGQVVKCDDYQPNGSGKEPAIGIHFFLSRERAVNFCLEKPSSGNGVFKEWWTNGRLASITHFRNGKKDGPYKSWFADGRPMHEGTYKEDKLIGAWMFRY